MNRKDFKLLDSLIYLDHSAGALKPKSVIDAGVDFYENFPINPHSVDSAIGAKLFMRIKEIRANVADLNNVEANEVIFTGGTTDGLNQIARMFDTKLKAGDEILLSYLNHSSNVVPWMELAKKTGAIIKWSHNVIKDINSKTKIVAIAEMNNTIDNKTDMKLLYKKTQEIGAFLINDAAQSVIHKPVDAQYADFTVWSSNKLYGPTGTGVMILKESIKKQFPFVYFGGGAVSTYSDNEWKPKDDYHAYEAGTPNTAGIIMLGAALDYINEIGLEKIWSYENEVCLYAFDVLSKLDNITWASKRGDLNLVFNINGSNAQDVVSYLGHNGVILRAGQHCVKNIKETTGSSSWIRASLGLYTEKADFDKLYELISKGGDFIDFI